ncbi:HAD family hydrolase [Ketobacter sp.]|uniref:HAD family hydrolase n=1 Tax=Ketobacter sp. TaxID=2083498 RepID=UPI000F209E9F|nr:HAD-IA family hydrolase [Ketobacter sp.]RLU01447.1 MAG: HAD family hydrolase [Ketobacter sp.]
MSQYQLIVFDWDGTLMNSLSRIADCMQAAARDLALTPATDQQVHDVVGLALDIAIQRLHPQLDGHQVAQMRERYSHHYVVAESTPSPFYGGIPEMLGSLSAKGALLSVATGKSRKGLSRVFAAHGVESLFHSSRCADETRSKPEPDMLLEILAMHGLNPDQAVMVGDTEFDLEMARRAGVDSVGVTWGAHDITRLQRHHPKVCVDSVASLSNWLHQAV